MACRILVPRPGIEPLAPAVVAQRLSHWTAREVPGILYLFKTCKCLTDFLFLPIRSSHQFPNYKMVQLFGIPLSWGSSFPLGFLLG